MCEYGNCPFAMATPRKPMKKDSIPPYTTVYKIAEGWLLSESWNLSNYSYN
jgi:hypothetical protein